MISFAVWALPKAKPRMTQRDRFNPSPAARDFWSWGDQVRIAARQAMAGRELLTEAISLSAIFYLPIPGSWKKSTREAAAAGELAHLSRPDLKNLIAGLEDVCNRVIWLDDAQVVEYGVMLKCYSPKCGVTVVIQQVADYVSQSGASRRYSDAAKALALQANQPQLSGK